MVVSYELEIVIRWLHVTIVMLVRLNFCLAWRRKVKTSA